MIRTALQFSGGKDSLALLLHMKALWPLLDVIHVDTGDLPDKARELVAEVEAGVPRFVRIKTDSVRYRKENGDPTGENWNQCCMANIWGPMLAHIQERGYRQLIRGTKACDPHIHTVFPGDVINGILYTFPLWNWSEKDVDNYLGDYLPEAYRNGATGMPDCLTCPAVEACGGHTRKLWRAA
jgi:3'-phosphoadenosine 5'-phosphosulfate sulfotransferase (PAPS reductase)/FAD synthetase